MNAKVDSIGRRTVDVVFAKARVAVFVDGCFWHGCPIHRKRLPIANGDYWTAKLALNVERDADTTARLDAAGWLVLRFWEHERPADAADAIEEAVRPGP